MESRVIFEGPSPFDLPTAHKTTVIGHIHNGVTVTLFCQVAAHNAEQAAIRSTEPEAIRVQMNSDAAEELAGQLLSEAPVGRVVRHRAAVDRIEYKELRHYLASDRMKIEWQSDKTANVYLIADDRRATVATISATTLALWQEDIVRALADRPKPTPHQ